MQKIKKGDEVVVLAGCDKGKTGSVLRLLGKDRALVNNVNIVKKHTKPNPMAGVTGGILEQESPIHLSNVAIYNSKTSKADKISIETGDDGKRYRVYRSSGDRVDS
ncbi:MAG: 50S ribosomal protein L24 [Proteobacteria bacterium]|nr:50S ribosomal protein L24 [Pseudomonadota bacterium]